MLLDQGGCGAAPPTWATVDDWLRKQAARTVLLAFENGEDALPENGKTRQVRCQHHMPAQ